MARWATIACLGMVCLPLLCQANRPRDAGPNIFNLQFARTKKQADEIIEQWRKAGAIGKARLGIWWDFAFLIAYGLFLALLCREFAALVQTPRFAALSRWTATWAPRMCIAGAGFDAAEDIGTLVMLGGRVNQIVVLITTVCARIKFGLLIVAFVAAVLCLVPE